ncbi:MAG: shikimate dehydrogenase [Verrucomicrobiota bacterium]|jgi:shikimate dehydrogenase|nr:shikimate dehydrogenase [Verrucomicrobiota bacterium]
MPKEFNFLSQLTGSFGRAAAGNATVAMIEEAYRHHEMDWRYLNCEVSPEGLGDAVRGARAMGWAGFNCSLPHKVAVIDHLDGLGDSAAIMRAVNCAVRRGEHYIGENTDGKGFLMSLEGVVDPRAKKIVLLGAGGAARALAVELALAGASSITVVNRGFERGAELVRLINERTPAKAELVVWDRTYQVKEGTEILINVTSVGLYPDVDARLDIDVNSLKSGMVVADIVPSPPRTHLIIDAEARGCQIVDGLGMLVNQGVISIKYWSGIDVDAGVMRRKLEEIYG